MLFNSIAFVIFFPVVTLLYFFLPFRFRWALLLAASCFFYMFFKPEYILILGFTIVIDYIAGILLENEQDKARKKKFLIMSLIANIGVLAVFKYYNFFNNNISVLAQHFGFHNNIPFLNFVLPIGLSFHTFQAMSYTIEVYRGNQKAERHFGIYSLYVMFYPQLVAGPIERPQNVLHQFHEEKHFDYRNAVSGIQLMLWGMFKKVVIADRLAMVTDPVFNNPHGYNATSLFVAAIFFSFQIYCDFSGYSDIAIGCARVMGFKLMQNFNRPYNATTITDFWRRWHISLSTWFKDYLYIPLGGNKVAMPRRYLNLFIVFLVSGFWHGANWTYIIWGALHGFYSVFGTMTANFRKGINKAIGLSSIKWLDNFIQRLTTFILVTTAWVFFRANTASDAFYIFRKLPEAVTESLQAARQHLPLLNLGLSTANLLLCFVVIGILELVHFFQNKGSINSLMRRQPPYLRWAIYYACLLAILYIGIFEKRQFIYFQF
jgi:D-alanyl-lipoteichoic acid acyltransferase DltB (MBOAT superfamily)